MAPSGSGPNPAQIQQLAATASALVHARSFTDATFADIDLSSIVRINNHDQVQPVIAELTAQVEEISSQVPGSRVLTLRRLDSRLVHGSIRSGIELVLLPLACAQQAGLVPISCRSAHLFRIVRAKPYVRVLQKATWPELYERLNRELPGGIRALRQARCSCV